MKNKVTGFFLMLFGIIVFFMASEAEYQLGERNSYSTHTYKTISIAVEKQPKFREHLQKKNVASLAFRKSVKENLNLDIPKNGIDQKQWLSFWVSYAQKCFNEAKQDTGNWNALAFAYCDEFYVYISDTIKEDTKPLIANFKIGNSDHINMGDDLALFYLLSCLSVICIILGAGVVSRGDWTAAWTDENNRLSLSRLQMIIWTTIVLSSISVFSFLNMGLLTQKATRLTEVNIFPEVPPTLILLMGISIATPVAAFLIKKDQSEGLGRITKSKVTLASNLEEGARPKLSDLFTKHIASHKNEIDFSALQNLLFTILLAGFYIAAILTVLEHLSPMIMMKSSIAAEALLKTLPKLGPSFTALILISHSAYLTVMATREGKQTDMNIEDAKKNMGNEENDISS